MEKKLITNEQLSDDSDSRLLEYDKLKNDDLFISIKKLVKIIAAGNNADEFVVLKELCKIIPNYNHIKCMFDLDFEYTGTKYKETLQLDLEQIITPLCCLAENSYGDIFGGDFFDNNEVEYNTSSSKRKLWKYRYKIDNFFIDIPVGNFYVNIDAIKQPLIDHHISISGRRFDKKRKFNKHKKARESYFYCVKRSDQLWGLAVKNCDEIIRTAQMASLLFDELNNKEMWLPADVTKISIWLQDAARNNYLTIPAKARKRGRPTKM